MSPHNDRIVNLNTDPRIKTRIPVPEDFAVALISAYSLDIDKADHKMWIDGPGDDNRVLNVFHFHPGHNKTEVMEKSWLEKLTELQNKVGYVEGDINPIAIMGLFGECGEVLNEIRIIDNKGYLGQSYFERLRSICVAASSEMDKLKKVVRDSKEVRSSVSLKVIDEDALDEEIADQLYYLNALAINRGKTLEQYAQISHNKVIRKSQIDISTGNENKETVIP